MTPVSLSPDELRSLAEALDGLDLTPAQADWLAACLDAGLATADGDVTGHAVGPVFAPVGAAPGAVLLAGIGLGAPGGTRSLNTQQAGRSINTHQTGLGGGGPVG